MRRAEFEVSVVCEVPYVRTIYDKIYNKMYLLVVVQVLRLLRAELVRRPDLVAHFPVREIGDLLVRRLLPQLERADRHHARTLAGQHVVNIRNGVQPHVIIHPLVIRAVRAVSEALSLQMLARQNTSVRMYYLLPEPFLFLESGDRNCLETKYYSLSTYALCFLDSNF